MNNPSLDPKSVRELSAYIPQIYRQAITQNRELPTQSIGSVLFADISGFTMITRQMSKQLGRQKGAEAVLAQINPVYEAIISVLHHFGGSVINFMGDGVLCWFDEAQGRSCNRAIHSALIIKDTMQQFASVTLPNGESIPLSIKQSLACGPAFHVVVGDPSIRKLKTMAGETIHRAARIGDLIQAGEIGVSPEMSTRFGDELRLAPGDDPAYMTVLGLDVAVDPAPWDRLEESQMSHDQIRPWLPASVYSRISNGASFWGDLRPVTPMMVRFKEPNFDTDPDAHAKLNRYISWVQQTIHAFGGNLIQLTIGDKGAYLYAPFGAPIAHEDDLRRASLAAIVLHQPPVEIALPDEVQIGLSRGDVWTGACGAPFRCTYGVMGDDVNLTARLMMQARPGQTIVTEKMADPTQFIYREIGAFLYKGFPHWVRSFELLDQKEQAEKYFSHPLFDRVSELEAMQSALQPIYKGRFAGVVIVNGDAGIGKSHLVNQLSIELGDSVTWVEGAFDSVQSTSLLPFKQMIKSLFNQSAEQTPFENRACFDIMLNQLIQALPEDQEYRSMIRKELVRTRSFLAALGGLILDGSLYMQLAPKLRFNNQLYAFKNLMRALGVVRPIILHLDDAHWIDSDSIEMLDVLMRNSDDIPIGIVVSARPTGKEKPFEFNFPEGTQVTTIRLKELSKPGIEHLLTEVCRYPVSEAAVSFLSQKTNGNPLFVQQLALDLQERNLLQLNTESGRFELDADDSAEIPTTLNTVLVSRLDRLGDAVKHVVQTAAVLGREFEVQLLSRMLANQFEQIVPQVEAAEEAQIWSALNRWHYLFRHVLMRDAAYRMQIRTRLKALHRLAAESIETLYVDQLTTYAPTLAYHYDLAEQFEDAQKWYEITAKQYLEAYANQEAILAYTRAIELAPEDALSTRFEILVERQHIYGIIGNSDDRKADIDRLLELGKRMKSTRFEVRAYLAQGRFLCQIKDREAGIQALKKGLGLLDSHPEPQDELRVDLYLEWARACWHNGNYDLAKEKLLDATPFAERRGAEKVAEIESVLSVVHGISGDVDGAIRHAEAALTLFRQLGDKMKIGTALNSLGIQARRQGHYSEAEAYYSESLQMMREVGFWYGIGVMRNNLALIWYEQGAYERALRELERSIQISRDSGIKRLEAWSMSFLAAVYLRLNRLSTAKDAADRAVEFAKAHADPDIEGYATLYMGLVLIATEEWESAIDYLRESIEIREKLKQANLTTEPIAGLIEIALLQGCPETVSADVEKILAILDTDPTLSGPSEPFRVHDILYRYLVERNDPRAGAVLARAAQQLKGRAGKITTPEMRSLYLERVVSHSRIMKAIPQAEQAA